eukprot:1960360-Alexandrium_andersonii.AAC.1
MERLLVAPHAKQYLTWAQRIVCARVVANDAMWANIDETPRVARRQVSAIAKSPAKVRPQGLPTPTPASAKARGRPRALSGLGGRDAALFLQGPGIRGRYHAPPLARKQATPPENAAQRPA